MKWVHFKVSFIIHFRNKYQRDELKPRNKIDYIKICSRILPETYSSNKAKQTTHKHTLKTCNQRMAVRDAKL